MITALLLSGTISILALGDSLTYGELPDHTTLGGYPTQLSALLGRPVHNEGHQGFRTDQLLRFTNKPYSTVILMAGANDIGQGRDPRVGMALLLNALSGRRVILMPIPPLPRFAIAREAYNGWLKDESAIRGLTWVDPMIAPRSLGPDLVHLQQAGYEQIAQALAARL